MEYVLIAAAIIILCIPNDVLARIILNDDGEATPAINTAVQEAHDTINHVKQTWGQLRANPEYVIANNALFDEKHAPTKALFQQLMLLEELPDTDPSFCAEAKKLGTLWVEARSYAEKLGYRALAQPDQGRRATKLLKASTSTSGAEQKLIMEKLRACLDTLGIVLPAKLVAAIDKK